MRRALQAKVYPPGPSKQTMPLSPGDRIAHYDVTALLDEGAWGAGKRAQNRAHSGPRTAISGESQHTENAVSEALRNGAPPAALRELGGVDSARPARARIREKDMASNNDELDYQQTAAYFQVLHEARFKLLAILPVVAGVAIAAIRPGAGSAQSLVALLGFFVTLGLAIYDQRNTQIYDRLVTRGQYLERVLRFRKLPSAETEPVLYEERKKDNIGPFHCRPPLRHRWLSHDSGISLVYAATLGAWASFLALSFGAPQWFQIATLLVGTAVVRMYLDHLAELNDAADQSIKMKVRAEHSE